MIHAMMTGRVGVNHIAKRRVSSSPFIGVFVLPIIQANDIANIIAIATFTATILTVVTSADPRNPPPQAPLQPSSVKLPA